VLHLHVVSTKFTPINVVASILLHILLSSCPLLRDITLLQSFTPRQQRSQKSPESQAKNGKSSMVLGHLVQQEVQEREEKKA
jgi:hypothetical protein